jgi:hypothetical protein
MVGSWPAPLTLCAGVGRVVTEVMEVDRLDDACSEKVAGESWEGL